MAGGSPEPAAPEHAALTVQHLSVTFPGTDAWSADVHAVRKVSFAVRPGEVLGIVGESGSGKTTTALAVVGLLPRGARASGDVRLSHNGRVELGDLPDVNVLELHERELATVRGRAVGIVFQDPAAALNPVRTVGAQLAEAVRANLPVTRRQARDRAVELLERVEVPGAAGRARSYPHELSGGLRQRVLIAMALAGEPHVLIADEPTAALDVTVQAQVLDTLADVRAGTGAALVLVSHDLGVIAGHADRVLVTYAGRVVEAATVDDLFERACMPYTLGLLGAVPRLDGRAGERLVTIPGAAAAIPGAGPGCPFAPRCPLVTERCMVEEPPLRVVGRHRHLVACHHAEKLRGDPLTLAAGLAGRGVDLGGDTDPDVGDAVRGFPSRHAGAPFRGVTEPTSGATGEMP